ncbi:hypothetical protein GCM10023156_18340 [Novipirellula rosea]|uniref:PEP-CTERM protein-sorting domain-containing protein n=2 Tax=Novipirellula rosea TaxID=1031540 RepID=A0ABP8MIA5_9BACT
MVLTIFCFAHHAHGALVVTVGNGTGRSNPIQVTQNGSGAISFYISASDSTAGDDSFSLSGYDISVDFGGATGTGDNIGTPGSFSNFNAVALTGVGNYGPDTSASFNNTTAAFANLFAPPANFDFIVGDTNGGDPTIVEGAAPTGLFQLTFDVGNTPIGVYDVIFRTTTAQGLYTTNNTSFNTTPSPQPVIAFQGSVAVVSASAVPEPGSMLALAGVFAVGGVRQWRKKKRGAAEPATC